jgi:hypothetical protein
LFDYWPAYLIAFQGLSVWISWSLRKGFVSRDDYARDDERRTDQLDQIDKHLVHVVTRGDLAAHAAEEKQRVDGMERRIGRVEQTIAAAPGKGDISRLHQRLDDLSKTTSELNGTTRALTNVVDLMNAHLIEREK